MGGSLRSGARPLAAAFALGLLLCAAAPRAQELEMVTEKDFIKGKMSIDFGTRKNLDTTKSYVDGSPAKEATDVYQLELNVAKTTEYAGKIIRKPRLVSRVLGREEQGASLVFDVDVAVRNPKDLTQKKAVGKWAGTVLIDPNGVYNLDAPAGGSQLRMAIDAVGKSQAFVGKFGGRIRGKSPDKKGGVVADKVAEYTRKIQGKQVTLKVSKIDPLRFNGLLLGEGPALSYPKTTVNGNLDYDYETGNWLTNGITFKYTVNGEAHEDVVTGSIKWVEDHERATNGKGVYEFNLRFNEAKSKEQTDETAAFSDKSSSDEEAFFAVDDTIPAMTGTISYTDTMVGGGDEPQVVQSEVVYNLNANKLTKQQAVNLFKLWMVIVGPTNDE